MVADNDLVGQPASCACGCTERPAGAPRRMGMGAAAAVGAHAQGSQVGWLGLGSPPVEGESPQAHILCLTEFHMRMRKGKAQGKAHP